MGNVVGVYCVSHSPGITAFPDRAGTGQRERLEAGWAELRAEMGRSAPQAVVVVSVEHFTNFFFNNLPPFAIATSDDFPGPATEEMAAFLKVPCRRYPGAPAFASQVYRYALDHGFDPALVAGGFAFDENFCVPLAKLDPLTTLPVVPVVVNGVSAPFPTMRRCLDFGAMLRGAIEAQPLVERVAVLATGGLSHFIGMPAAGEVDEAFDREFLRRLAAPRWDRLVEYTDAEIDRAGIGAHEIRSWVVAAGAAGAPFETLAYEAVPAWLTGTALAVAMLPGRRESADRAVAAAAAGRDTTDAGRAR